MNMVLFGVNVRSGIKLWNWNCGVGDVHSSPYRRTSMETGHLIPIIDALQFMFVKNISYILLTY